MGERVRKAGTARLTMKVFARKLAFSPQAFSEEDRRRIRNAGFSDDDIRSIRAIVDALEGSRQNPDAAVDPPFDETETRQR